MTRPILPVLPPALPGVAAPRAPAVPAPAVANAPASTRAGLDLARWGAAPAVATVRGDLPYAGDAGDAGAVAESIAALLFERG
jgi:hypothetical protein